MSLDRAQRRAAEAVQRKFRKKTLSHRCVLEQASVEADALVVVEPGAEQHRLHVAMGEPWCGACDKCRELRFAGKPPTVLSERETAAMLDYWATKVDAAKGGHVAAKLQAERQRFERAVFARG